MLGEGFELRWCPAPILEHLGRGFDEILDSTGAMETRICGTGNKVVDTVAEFCQALIMGGKSDRQ